MHRAQKKHLPWFFLFYPVGILVAYYSKGAYQLDEHYQVLEWSRWIMGLSFSEPWEATQGLRHPLLAYIMAGFIWFLQSLRVSDPESLIALLRIFSFLINGSIQIFCIHRFSNRLFRERSSADFAIFLFIAFPLLYYFFARTSSENYGTSCLLLSLTLISDLGFGREKWVHFLSGFFAALAFSMRFPLATALSGHAFLLYKQGKKKKWKEIFSFLCGLLLGACLFVFVEYSFYGHPFLSAVQYFNFNVLGGSAKAFGTDPGFVFLFFFLIFAAPLNLFLFHGMIHVPQKRGFFLEDGHFPILFPVFLSTATFLLIHLFIGHKEMRFLFPLIPFLFILYVYFSSQLGLLKNEKILASTFAVQFIISFTFQMDNRFSFNYLEMACGPYQFERQEPVTSVWSENQSMGFHKLPAFFCGTPYETLPVRPVIPVETFASARELRSFLNASLPLTPPPEEPGKPRFIDKDGFFRSYESRRKQLETLPLLVSFRRAEMPDRLPEDCECGVIEPYQWHGRLPSWIRQYFKLKFCYYLFCPGEKER